MRASIWLTIFGLALGTWAGPVEAQLLERLERGLDRIEGALSAPDDSSPAAEPLPSPDDANRPTLGLSTKVDGEPGGGVLIETIVPNGPAARAGLRTGDLITRANGKPVNSADALGEILSGARIGDRAAFTIRSAGRDRAVEVVFARRVPEGGAPRVDSPPPTETNPAPEPANDSPLERPGPLPTRPEAPLDPAIDTRDRPTLGASVGPVTDEAAERYGTATRRGALITRVTPEGPADRAGLPVGGVVVAIDGVRIDTADQLVDAVRTSRAGQEIELSYYNGPTLSRKTVRLGSAGPAPSGIGPPSPRTNRIDLGLPPALDPVNRPAGREPAAGPASSEMESLRDEVRQLREQLRELQERLDRIERTPAAAEVDDGGAAASPSRFAPPRP